VYVLDAIAGYDRYDANATRKAAKYIPHGGYMQFLKLDGLKGKRIGILRKIFFDFPNNSLQRKVFEHHFNTMRYVIIKWYENIYVRGELKLQID
jgi:amidase